MSARKAKSRATDPTPSKQEQEQAQVTPLTSVTETKEAYSWKRQSIQETFARIQTDLHHPWLAIGDFLDDWRFTEVSDRADLVREGISAVDPHNVDLLRWAAFCAAMVEWLCWQDGLPFPAWTARVEYRLEEPWFLYPGDLLRAWQLAMTPAPFKMRNIFGGDQMFARA